MAEFFASKDWQTFLDVLPSIPAETWDTFYSTVVATLFALVIGLPLGVLLVTGEPGGVRPLPRWAMRLLNGVINLLRSVPFLILMIIVIPLSRLIVGTSIGTVASIVPLVIASFPLCPVWWKPASVRWISAWWKQPRAWGQPRCRSSPRC